MGAHGGSGGRGVEEGVAGKEKGDMGREGSLSRARLTEVRETSDRKLANVLDGRSTTSSWPAAALLSRADSATLCQPPSHLRKKKSPLQT